jgi:hypothetical protein
MLRPVNESWSRWITGLVFGAALAVLFSAAGLFVVIAGTGMLLARSVNSRSLALLSGGLVGLGGSWTGLLIVAEARCDAMNQQAQSACTSSGHQPFLAIYLAITAFGLVAGAGAIRPQHHRRAHRR